MKHNYWKRTLAGVMALALTVGAVPLNTGAGLLNGAAIVASATATNIPENGSSAGGSSVYIVGNVASCSVASSSAEAENILIHDPSGATTEKAAEALFDGNGNNKLCCTFKDSLTINFSYNFEFVPNMYYVRNADDTEGTDGRNMKTWTLQAKNASGEWITLHSGSNLPRNNNEAFGYSIDTTEAYHEYRLTNITTDGKNEWATAYNGTFQLSEIYMSGDIVVAHAPYDVVLNGVENAAVTGETTQNDVTKRISTVTYTADEGYYFAEFADIVKNGITVKRVDNYTVTVSGAPTADTTIETIPNAVAIPGVMLGGGQNAVLSGSNTVEGLTYTANNGYYFAEFEDIVQNGITVKRVDNYTVTVSGFPTADTMLTVPDAAAIPSVTLSGGANAVQSGNNTIEGITYTANDGYYFAKFEDIVQNGITVKRVDNYTVTVSGFPTAATAITIPDAIVVDFIEDCYDFEDGQIPEGWTQQSSNADYHWENGTGDYSTATGAHSGSKNLHIRHNSYGPECYLIMPAMDLSAVQSADIDLWYINRDWSYDTDEFGVYYRIGETGEWNEVFHTAENHETWTNLNVSLPAEALTGNVQIGFKAVSQYGYGVGLDDVVITQLLASKTTSLADATLTFDKASFNYTGKAITPELTVKYGDTTLTEGEDYEIAEGSATSATAAGDYTVTVNGIGNYEGTASAIWQIVAPAEYSISVENGTFKDSTATSDKFTEATPVTVVGNTKKGYWTDENGNIVSYKREYKLYAMYDTVLTWNDDATQETAAVANINLSERTYNATTKKTTVKVTSEWSLPAGATIIEAGTMRAASTEEITAEQLTDASYFKKSTLTTARGTFYFNINLSEATKNKTIYAMTYVKYTYNGETKTLYSNMLTSAPALD